MGDSGRAPAKSCSGHSPRVIGKKSMFLLKVRSGVNLDVDLGFILEGLGYEIHLRGGFSRKK